MVLYNVWRIKNSWNKLHWFISPSFILLMLCIIFFPSLTRGEYSYTELLPPGWQSASASAINDNGIVIGNGSDGSASKGFIYSNGTYTDLLPPGWQSAGAFAINDSGTVIGNSNNEGTGFIYSNGTYEVPEPWWGWWGGIGGPWFDAINDSGVVVGVFCFDIGGYEYFFYSNGTYTFFSPGGQHGLGCAAINNSGTVVGSALKSGYRNYVGVVCGNGTYTYLLPPGWQSAGATAINDSGVVIGNGSEGSTSKGFIYSNGTYTYLLPPGWQSASAGAINDSGIVIGYGTVGSTNKGFLAVENPTVVGLSSFTANPSDRQVILQWTTASEIDNVGFNLYRAKSADGGYVKINPSMIPAQGFPTQGAAYQFVDENVKNRTTYYYKLEDIDLNGTSTMHGLVSATPRRVKKLRVVE